MTRASDEESVPVSVRLGAVVPPEDPEDWRRPLTWVAALGMLAGPLIALAWFALGPPTDADRPLPATIVLAAIVSVGAAVTGSTQIGRARAWTATVGAGLFATLGLIVLGVVMAGERQTGVASPTLSHAFAAGLAGFGGAVVASVAAAVASGRSRVVRALLTGGIGGAAAVAVLGFILG